MSQSFEALKALVFDLLIHTYVQQQDKRQREMGLQYTTAETHELADVIARLVLEVHLKARK